MRKLSELRNPVSRPERILQFGEGNFLRAFVDWLIQNLNDSGLLNGSVVLVQPIERGLAQLVNENKGLYTVMLRGLEQGKRIEEASVIDSVSRCINPYTDYETFMDCAGNPDLRFIVSNTTEAGIKYQEGESIKDMPPASFPAKLTQFLFQRWKTFNGDNTKGLVCIPCELIDRNGDTLRNIVFQLADEWKLGKDFIDWVHNSCAFLNSLVDRIVTGYPREEAEQLWQKMGYKDELLDTAEPFLFWVIEGDKKYAEELPLHKTDGRVLWTDDMTPYRTRKVRILNGAHTASVLIAYLAGFDTVREMIESEPVKKYLTQILYHEIIPELSLPAEELESFAEATLERFANPFIKHKLLDISLNSVSKFKARVLPSLLEYFESRAELPSLLSFSLSSLFAFYHGTRIENGVLLGNREKESYSIRDDLPVLECFAQAWRTYERDTASGSTKEACKELVSSLLAQKGWWGLDLRCIAGLEETCTQHLFDILDKGALQAMKAVQTAEHIQPMRIHS